MGPPNYFWALELKYIKPIGVLCAAGGVSFLTKPLQAYPTCQFLLDGAIASGLCHFFTQQIFRGLGWSPTEEELGALVERNQAMYFENLNEQFESQRPTENEIKAILHYIKNNCAALTTDGIGKQDRKFYLDEEKDFISWEKFDPSEIVEWCALKRAEGHFDLVTVRQPWT